MPKGRYRVYKPSEYKKAGPTDLIELAPAPGRNPLFLIKSVIEELVYAIVHHEFIHLSGPTGTAKSSLLEALSSVPANFRRICKSLGFRAKPLKLYPIEMATFEAPGELYHRRSLKDGTTFDEKSRLVVALEDAAMNYDKCYPLIWLREIGRVHSSSVQGGLLNLMHQGDIVVPDGSRINGGRISWVADSNYQAEHDSIHTLVTLDDALKRRFSVNLTLDYLTAEQEVAVLQQILGKGNVKRGDHNIIIKVVQLGHAIRRYRLEGNLHSVAPPTISGYLACIRMADSLSHLSIQQVALATLLGNASLEDQKHVSTVFNEVFGLHAVDDEDPAVGGNLF